MKLQINNQIYNCDVAEDTPLLWVIRDNLGLTGTKYGCGLAQCGACSVMIDGAVIRSCSMPVSEVVGKQIITIEAIEEDPVGIQVVSAWNKHQVPQCGYCQSGQVIAVTALFKSNESPSRDEINSAVSNLCRCGTYNAIDAAIEDLSNANLGSST
ncbi:(2Fe-2S)-binding protein [Vibrio marisflavi]|uniref:Isoquinoline 1-oxidoreductase subunit alpha n=1 Tax=Vibrio marisflavi CECT 7928 TaxID=634439 RepID=A0ABN8E7D6_9VIBR|nr:(2Fe-2S)-binding protein [Vibrio marisflavi]CAH0540387.1 Isoquinoline 1-oxidoreductase subunit alpha [Vibrio marisflavi CECT 7928]